MPDKGIIMVIRYDLSNITFEDIKADIEGDTTVLIQDIAIGITNTLRGNAPIGTPILTGWAANNWIPAIQNPPNEPYGERPPEGKKFTDSSASDAGIAALLTWELGQGTVFVVNNVPYIESLNQGHSKQSPAGFVENAIDGVLDKVVYRKR